MEELQEIQGLDLDGEACIGRIPYTKVDYPAILLRTDTIYSSLYINCHAAKYINGDRVLVSKAKSNGELILCIRNTSNNDTRGFRCFDRNHSGRSISAGRILEFTGINKSAAKMGWHRCFKIPNGIAIKLLSRE